MHSAEIRPFPRAVIVVPTAEPPPAYPVPTQAIAGRDMDFSELRHRLGLDDAAPRSVVDYIRHAIQRRGCPPPKNPRRWGGEWRHGADAVGRKSKWDRYLVERWLSGDLPPAAAQAVATRRRDDVRAQLAANAAASIAAVA